MVFDGIIVGMFIAALIEGFVGNTPLARLLRLVVSIGCGIGYFLLCTHIGWGEFSGSLGVGLIVMLLPVGAIIVLKVIDYMYSGQNENQSK